MIPQALSEMYPYQVRIIGPNGYCLPQGKVLLCGRRKEGDGSPFPIEAFSYAGNYQRYQFKESEAVLEPRP